jgi:arabinoxylan arabinofuranohydrolase
MTINAMKRIIAAAIIGLIYAHGALAQTQAVQAADSALPKIGKDSAYLFAYFTGNGKDEEAIRFALSADGYNYRALNANNPVVSSEKVGSTAGLRDPHILRAADGKTFYMVATDMNVAKNGWGANYAMVFLKSKDLINWSSTIVNIPANIPEFANVNRVWAPQTIYDPAVKKYMVYWSMRTGNQADIIYYAYANADFTGIEGTPKQLFYKPDGGACIDADIVYKDGYYNLFFKTEGNGLGIKKAVSKTLTGGYELFDKILNQTTDAVEGADVFSLINSDTWILMYDVYMKGKYQFCKSTDLENFSVIDNEISMNFHPRHGTVIHVSAKEAKKLIAFWDKKKP